MSPELKTNLILWELTNRTQNTINRTNRILEFLERRKKNDYSQFYGRRDGDKNKERGT